MYIKIIKPNSIHFILDINTLLLMIIFNTIQDIILKNIQIKVFFFLLKNCKDILEYKEVL